MMCICRMCLDDNHNSVVLACARVIECIICSDMNENFFDKLEVKFSSEILIIVVTLLWLILSYMCCSFRK